jgi:hypothetical protein
MRVLSEGNRLCAIAVAEELEAAVFTKPGSAAQTTLVEPTTILPDQIRLFVVSILQTAVQHPVLYVLVVVQIGPGDVQEAELADPEAEVAEELCG